uniref:THAP-type domain-containing protein n=1 Tax=Sparus aurata TaxID=8175 RepID=A0A671UY45_SPAAU
MPSICCAVGCNNSKSNKDGHIFYNIPKNTERRQKWIAAIRRIHWTPTEHSRWRPERKSHVTETHEFRVQA